MAEGSSPVLSLVYNKGCMVSRWCRCFGVRQVAAVRQLDVEVYFVLKLPIRSSSSVVWVVACSDAKVGKAGSSKALTTSKFSGPPR